MWQRLLNTLTLGHEACVQGLSPCRVHPGLSLNGWLLTCPGTRGGRRRFVSSWAATPITRSPEPRLQPPPCTGARTHTLTGPHARAQGGACTPGFSVSPPPCRERRCRIQMCRQLGAQARKPQDLTMSWRRVCLLRLLVSTVLLRRLSRSTDKFLAVPTLEKHHPPRPTEPRDPLLIVSAGLGG